MADFRERVIEQLGMKLRSGQKEFSDDEILRKIEVVQDAYKNTLERESLLDFRFQKLSEAAGEEVTQEVMSATPTKEKMGLLRWLDPRGSDFLGSGMSLSEWLMSNSIQNYKQGYAAQLRDEQQRRMDLIIRLSVELDRIRKTDLHGTAFIETVLENIVKGESAERHNQDVGFMLDRESRRLASGTSPEAQAEHEKYLDERDKLWAPAVQLARQYTEAFEPPPADRHHYDTWEEMLEKEPGMSLVQQDPERVWMRTHEVELWGQDPVWGTRAFYGKEGFWKEHFERGVRWRGPRDMTEVGYWHMDNGQKFPDNPDKWWGNNYYRIYRHRDLSSWLYRQRKE